MENTGENIDSEVHLNRNLGFNVVKDIFMINAMMDQSKASHSKRVLDLKEYCEKQTNLCVAIAVDALNHVDISVPVEKLCKEEKFNITGVEPVNSNCIMGQTFDKKDTNLYFHTNFVGKAKGDSDRSLYFAEVRGIEGPEEAVCCVKMSDGGVTGNCAFCTGIKHPVVDTFFGKIQPIKTYSRRRRT